MDSSLDLVGRLRPDLDIRATEIILSLKKRKRHKQNPEIYVPGLVVDQPDTSLLMFQLHRMERYHAELGRYTFASQQPFTDVSGSPLIIKRDAPPSPIKPFRNDMGETVIDRYLQWVKAHCEEGTDTDEFGETVTSDVEVLLNIFERINLGMLVAESKYLDNPKDYEEAQGDKRRIRDLLVNKRREGQVTDLAARLAECYDFEPTQARALFAWMIELTVEVEIKYIQARKPDAANKV